MIRKSFIFLDKIGKKSERNIWAQGIRNWEIFLKTKNVKGISRLRKGYYDRRIMEARKALYSFDASYFIKRLPSTETWRLYDFFREEAIFLDIETSGVGPGSFITVIGLFDGINTKTMIKGVNLNIPCLKKELSNYQLIITFNGSSFDLPFIQKRHRYLLPDIPHFDLRFACEKLGLKGGLKHIEKSFKIKRNEIINKLCGGDVLTLWKMWRSTNDEYYLRLLIEYNEEDVISLKPIADFVYDVMEKNLNVGILSHRT